MWLTQRRWKALGGNADDVIEVSVWALFIWDGGLGIWGAVALGGPTTLPWALQIDPAHRPPDTPAIGLYHPTFRYECLWNIGIALLLLWVDKRLTLRTGKLFALYVASYTVGRAWVEAPQVWFSRNWPR